VGAEAEDQVSGGQDAAIDLARGQGLGVSEIVEAGDQPCDWVLVDAVGQVVDDGVDAVAGAFGLQHVEGVDRVFLL
jgi:hypothetical protein